MSQPSFNNLSPLYPFGDDQLDEAQAEIDTILRSLPSGPTRPRMQQLPIKSDERAVSNVMGRLPLRWVAPAQLVRNPTGYQEIRHNLVRIV